MNISRLPALTISIALIISFNSCSGRKEAKAEGRARYETIRDSVLKDTEPQKGYDSSTVLDDPPFDPGSASFDSLLLDLRQMWRNQLFQGPGRGDTLTGEEKGIARLNLAALDSFLVLREKETAGSCREMDCVVYVEVRKSVQKMYLYIDTELVDSFKVSTGLRGEYETPSFSVRPHGPVFTKYTSRKFPGGDYKGLGNMPYAVFVRGGYAIHGTTPGNFSKLGTRASHGCIRLHPDNAKVFNEIVRIAGLGNTWVRVME